MRTSPTPSTALQNVERPVLSLASVSKRGLEKARKLQRAMMPSLERLHDRTLTAVEFEQRGIERFKAEFGYAISERHWRRVLKRTIERDGGRNDWSRTELYLDQNPGRRPTPRIIASPQGEQFHQLWDLISQFRNPAEPNVIERSFFWVKTFELFEALAHSNRGRRRLATGLRAFLVSHAPWIAENSAALKRAFNRKYKHWIASGRDSNSVFDGRARRKGEVRGQFDRSDLELLIGQTIFKAGGRISQGVRESAQLAALSPAMKDYLLINSADKSYVPRKLRNAVRHEVNMLKPLNQSKRVADNQSAWIERDWSKVLAMHVLQGDDFTFPVYFSIPDGSGWFTMTRGQCLLFIDAGTLRILGFALLPTKSYHSRAIRTAITKICSEHGLPKIFYFENGIWKNSHLLAGKNENLAFTNVECEAGLRGLGIRFIHSNHPRSKPVELVGKLLQDLMEGEPGYCGRNERVDCPQATSRALLDVRARRSEPGAYFYTFEQWEARLAGLCEKYNATEQDGKRLQKISPNEAFDAWRDPNDPPVRFDATCRHLLSHHRRPVTVTANGITFKVGRISYIYRDEQTSALRGQRVLAWFNPECPELLAVTDLNSRNPICIPRSLPVEAINPDPERFSQELARISAHNSYPKSLYRTLKAKFGHTFRRNLVDPDTAELGNAIATQASTVSQRQESRRKTVATLDKAGRSLGLPVPKPAIRNEESAEALERLYSAMHEIDGREGDK